MKHFFLSALLACTVLLAQANTYNVSNLGASPATSGTLAWAITQANANPGADIINFTVAGTVNMGGTSAFPLIQGPVSINGYTAPGASQGPIGLSSTAGNRKITVTISGGADAGNITTGTVKNGGVFLIDTSNVTISGLCIINTNANTSCVYIGSSTGADRSNIQLWGNYFGINADGTNAAAADYNGGYGINLNTFTLNASNNLVGNFSNIIIGTNGDGTNDANEGNVIANCQNGATYLSAIQLGGNTSNFTYTSSSPIRISGNYIGLSADGTTLAPVGTSSINCDGVNIEQASYVVVGSNGDGKSDPLEKNIISNCSGNGIFIQGNSSYNQIAGNFIGTDVTGTFSRPNGVTSTSTVSTCGITIYGNGKGNPTNNMIGFNDAIHTAAVAADVRNVISGNFSRGIGVQGTGALNTRICGNYIGTTASGNTALGNGQGTLAGITGDGISINQSVAGTVIGTNGNGVNDGLEGNVISGNGSSSNATANGIYLRHNANIVVAGNNIGVGADGMTSIPNIGDGIRLFNQNGASATTNNRIGTNSDGTSDLLERNIISSNGGNGIYINGASTSLTVSATTVAGNYIGVATDGMTAKGNVSKGILINNALNNQIGSNDDGTNDATEANIIANNGNKGLAVTGTVSTGNRISRNSFYKNSSLPIDLNDDGITVNDGSTSASTPNLLLDYPVFTKYAVSGNTVTVSGYVGNCGGSENTAGTTIAAANTVQVYVQDNMDNDQNGSLSTSCTGTSYAHGEGRTYLGSITTTSSGIFTNATFTSATTVTGSEKITGITINNAGNTSEFGLMTNTAILPVTGLSLSVHLVGKEPRLTWSTLTEQNTSSFVIQSSTDGVYFTNIGKVAAAGNSNTVNNYSFDDHDAFGSNVYYRIESVDKDGLVAYSNTVTVALAITTFGLRIYPNPATNFLNIDTKMAGNYIVELFTADGKRVQTNNILSTSGTLTIDLNRSIIILGIYYVKLTNLYSGSISNSGPIVIR